MSAFGRVPGTFGWKVYGQFQKQSIVLSGLRPVRSRSRTVTREFNYNHQKCSFSCHLVEMENVKVLAGLSRGKGIESFFFWAVQTFSIMKVASRVSVTDAIWVTLEP